MSLIVWLGDLMNRSSVLVVALAALAGCGTSADEFRQTLLNDGNVELVLPYSPSNAAAESAGLPIDALVNEHAKQACPDRSYRVDYQGLRQRPEYAHAERVWIIRCQ